MNHKGTEDTKREFSILSRSRHKRKKEEAGKSTVRQEL